jgi:hypothetical protein
MAPSPDPVSPRGCCLQGRSAEGAKKSTIPVILSEAKNLQLFLFKKINADASRSLPRANKLQSLRFAQGDSEGLSMTAHFFTPSPPRPYFLATYPALSAD